MPSDSVVVVLLEIIRGSSKENEGVVESREVRPEEMMIRWCSKLIHRIRLEDHLGR